MNEQPVPQHYVEEETDLLESLRIVIKHKWRICGFSLAVGVLTYAVLFFSPNTYKSSAGIIIQAPEMAMIGEAQRLSPEMCQLLAESTQVKRDVYDDLLKRGIIDEKVQFQSFLKALATEVQKSKAPQSQQLLPVFQLHATAKTPELAKDLANTWAKALLTHSNDIYKQGFEELGSFAGTVYDKAFSNLKENENKLDSKTLEANVIISKARFEQKQKELIKLHNDIFTKMLEIATTQTEIDDLVKRLNEQEINGVWIGEVLLEMFRSGSTPVLSALPISASMTHLWCQELVTREKELMDFTLQANKVLKENEIRNLLKDLQMITGKVMETDLLLSEKNSILKETTKQISEVEVDQTWVGDLLDEHYRGADNKPKPELNPISQKIDRSVGNSIQRELSLLSYKEKTDLQFKETQLKEAQDRIQKLLIGIETAKLELVSSEKRRDELTNQLTQIPEKISLDKAITNDALWNAHLEGKLPADGKIPVLKTEEMNPIHQSIKGSLSTLLAEIEGTKARIKSSSEELLISRKTALDLVRVIELAKMEIDTRERSLTREKTMVEVMAKTYSDDRIDQASLEQDIRLNEAKARYYRETQTALQSQIADLTRELELTKKGVEVRQEGISHIKSLIDLERKQYVDEKTKVAELRNSQVRMTAELALKEKTRDELVPQVESEELKIMTDELDISLLERELNKVKTTADSLMTKVEEISLLQLSAEQASRSGTRILFDAEVNPVKVGPFRSRWTLLSMAIAFVLSSVFFVVRESMMAVA
jgi:uncharacterized protein involved in exopolysaccharide biosynthesis